VIADILTVMWKERRGLFRQHGSRARAVFSIAVPIAVFGIMLPWQEGRGWVEGYWSLITSVFIPMLLVGTIIPESFAGERERHTLGTLLASRLPDRAILFGKIAVAVGYGWGVTLVVLLIGLMIANITAWSGQVVVLTPSIALADVVLSLLLAGIMASLGIFISLRATTVQGATQTLMAATMFPLLLLGVLVTSLVSMKVKWVERMMDAIGSADPNRVVAVGIAALFVICFGLLWAAMASFRRHRLIFS
jgi:ABC-2 type transport system permease protein